VVSAQRPWPKASHGMRWDKAVLSQHPEPMHAKVATIDRTGGRHLKIALVDPSLFTVPYDVKLAGALRGLGHEVIVYGEALARAEDLSGLGRMRGIFYLELLSLGARSWPIAAIRVAKGALHWRGMRRLVDEVGAEAPDVVHFQWLPLPAIDRLFLRRLRRVAPLVLTVHDSRPFNEAASRLQKFGAIGILTEFDRVIVHTQEARARLIAYGVRPSRLVRIAHGLLNDEEPVPTAGELPADTVRFLLFGKLKPYKGADLLIEAFRRLPRRLQVRAELHIVGKPYMDVRSLLKAADGLEGRVRLDFRFVPDAEMNQMLTRADVLVFPYREIDVSGVLMAALRYRRPIIASRIGGFAELLVDSRHGFLVPPGDVAALTAAMSPLMEQAATRRAMGAATADLAAAIPGWDQIARQTTELYRELLPKLTDAH
jgi:glycosyltransferase involved in cell wall biosynthesis